MDMKAITKSFMWGCIFFNDNKRYKETVKFELNPQKKDRNFNGKEKGKVSLTWNCAFQMETEITWIFMVLLLSWEMYLFFLTKENYLCHSTVTLLCFKSWSLYWHQWLDLETLFEIFYFIKMMLQFSFRVHINFRQQFLDETNVGESITITGYQKCQHVGSLMAMILLCC